MVSKKTDTFSIQAGSLGKGLEFWISLWPVAPLFGVKWRFAGLMPQMIPGFGSGVSTSTTSAKKEKPAEPTAAKAKESVIDAAAEDAVEVAPSPREAAEAETAAPGPTAAEPATATGAPDDLTRIKGIGPALAKQLNDAGITQLADLASLTPDQVAALDMGLTEFKGRCSRDDWVGQAKALVG